MRKILAPLFLAATMIALCTVGLKAQEIELGGHNWNDSTFNFAASYQQVFELTEPVDLVVKGQVDLDDRHYGVYVGGRYDLGPAHFQLMAGGQWVRSSAGERSTEPVESDEYEEHDHGLVLGRYESKLAVQPKITVKIPGSAYGVFGSAIFIPGHDDEFSYRFGLVLGL